MSATLDDIDRKLLGILQSNCKLNYSQISRLTNIPESTIRYRVERLEKQGIITGYMALLNPRKVGLKITAIMMIKIEPLQIDKVAQALSEFKELRHLFKTTGQYDMVSVVNARDIDHLNQLMGAVKQIPGVHEVLVEVATELVKVDPTFSLSN